VSVAQARAASVALGERLTREYPATNAGTGVVVVAEQRARPHLFLSSYTLPVAAVFMTLSGLVLLVACANVAGLLLSRTASRERELAVRAALGAGRGRIVRLLLIESLLLGTVGGAVALLIASWCAAAFGGLHFAVDAPIRFDVQPDIRVFTFTLALALGAGVLAGLAPALRGAAANLSDALRSGARAGGPVRQRLRSALVVAQVAVAIVVLASAGLFLRSLQHAGDARLGFDADRLLLASVAPADQGYDNARSHLFADRLLERVASLPGVRSASLARFTPMGYNNSSDRILPEGGMPDGTDNAVVFYNVVSPGYFATMGISLLEGRAFTAGDSMGAPRAAIVSRAMAKLVWPTGSAVGQRFRISGDSVPRVVVGVVDNTVWMSPSEEPRPFLYYPASQSRLTDFTLNIRTAGDPVAMGPAVRSVVHELDADLPLYDVRSLRQHLDGGLAFFSLHLGAVFSAVFGALALLLGAVGLFGLVAFSVAQRTREIGIRLALGAGAPGVQMMILRRGLTLVAAGLVIGLPAALLVGRAMQGLLIETGAADPLALGGGAALLLLVAGLAAWLPSRRAARVDPMEALRAE
jgi:predicted permease